MNIIKVQRITFGWDLCYTCNYRCPYCGVWEKGSDKDLLLTAEEWEIIWNKIYEKYGSCYIYLSGGEPSTYPYFYDLVYLLSKKHTIEICTNLSWNPEILISKISPLNLKIAPTFHPTFAIFEEFFKKIIRVKEYLPNNQVYYVAYPGQIKQMPERSKQFKKYGIDLIPLPLRGDGFVLNTEEEKIIIKEISPYRGEKIEYQLQRISPKGKLCRAGKDYAVIRADGKVDRCSQYSDGNLGNFLSSDFKLFNEPLVCEKEYCPIESQWIIN